MPSAFRLPSDEGLLLDIADHTVYGSICYIRSLPERLSFGIALGIGTLDGLLPN